MDISHRAGGTGKQRPLLTATELAVLAAVDDLTEELGHAPSHSQLLARLGWSMNSRGSVNAYLKRLRARGVIEGVGRSLRVVA